MSISSVNRQSEEPSTTRRSPTPTANANRCTINDGKRRVDRSRRSDSQKMSSTELAQTQISSPCRKCAKLGRWGDAHNPDGSLKPGTRSIDPQNVNISVKKQPPPSQSDSLKSDGNSPNSQKQAQVIGFIAIISKSVD